MTSLYHLLFVSISQRAHVHVPSMLMFWSCFLSPPIPPGFSPLCRRTQTYQSHDRAGASPPLIPCATYIKNSTFEAPPTLPTQPTDPPTQVKADLWEGGGAPCVGQPGSSGPQTCLSSVGTTEEKRGSDVSEDRGGGGRGVEPATKAKSRKVQVSM